MKFVKTLAVAAVASVMGVAAASAATVTPCGIGSGLECIATIADKGQPTNPYYPSNAGGGDSEAVVELALADATGTFVDLMLLGKSDGGYGSGAPNGALSGTFVIPDMADYITVKAANSYVLYAVGGVTSANWSTMGIENKNGQQQGLSHISYWKGGSSVVIPLPAAGWLMLAGLGGIAALRRRK